MSRAAILTWTVAVLFTVGIGIWVIHSHRLRTDACKHGTKKACIQAQKTEDGAILMGVLGAVFIIMAGGALVAGSRRRLPE